MADIGEIRRVAGDLSTAFKGNSESVLGKLKMKKFIEASDIAASAVFLSSTVARFITGQVLPVDGNIETMRA